VGNPFLGRHGGRERLGVEIGDIDLMTGPGERLSRYPRQGLAKALLERMRNDDQASHDP
jgi:hypothetical protein